MSKLSFEEWKSKVNRFVEAYCFLSCDDLEDQPYYDWYEDEVTPKEAATRVIRYSMSGEEDF